MKQIGEDNKEAITRYIQSDGDGVVLNPEQKKLLERVTFADEQIRRKTGLISREEIANIIRFRFECGRTTAYTYMATAEEIFSSSIPLNKKYLVQTRIEYCIQQIHLLDLNTSIDTKDKNDAKTKYEKILQGYIDIYPDYVPQKSATTIIYNIQNNNLIVTDKTEDEAFEEADVIIKHLEENDDY